MTKFCRASAATAQMDTAALLPFLLATFSVVVATAIYANVTAPSRKRVRAEYEAVDPFVLQPGFNDAYHFHREDVCQLAKVLRLPLWIKDPRQRHKARREDALLYLLYRIHFAPVKIQP
jgi:hypothetical protein